MDALIWLVVAIAAIIFEIISLGLTSIWFAGGAILTAVLALLGLSWILQILVFTATSILLLILTRPIARKFFDNKTNTNIDSLIGKKVLVISDINGEIEVGKIMLNEIEWSAIADGEEKISKGNYVYVKAIDGNKLIVSNEL